LHKTAKKILIDTDPGIDDAMAILLALNSPELIVIGLTSIFGNGEIEVMTNNALHLLALEGNQHIPVAKGVDRPLVIPLRSKGKDVHGVDGLGGIGLPPPVGRCLNIPAAQFIVNKIIENPGEITLVPIGPLTNIALALRLEPRIVDHVKEVVIMGGSAFAGGNASPVAEANIHNDPHAASIVFDAGWKLTMVGLDVTLKTVMTKPYLDELSRSGNPATDLIKRILPFYQKFHHETYAMNGDLHTHDPSAIAYRIDPGLFQVEQMPLFVELEGHCSGQTVPDRRNQEGEFKPINVCVGVDSGALLDMFKQRLMG
jgi:uridine nucleosidase